MYFSFLSLCILGFRLVPYCRVLSILTCWRKNTYGRYISMDCPKCSSRLSYIPNYCMGGVCLLLVKLIFDRLDVQKDLLWFMFVVFGVVWCSYARVSLAMCLMYYGFTLLFKPYKYKYLSYLIALSAIVASYYCHKTALFGIVLVVLATLIRNFNRRSIVLLVLSVPIIYMLLQTVISDYLLFDATGDDGSWNKSVVSAQGYMEREASVVGIGALLLKIVERSAYIVTGSMAAFMILKDKNNKRSPVINAFFRLDIIMTPVRDKK